MERRREKINEEFPLILNDKKLEFRLKYIKFYQFIKLKFG
jgi:hypothetical protein